MIYHRRDNNHLPCGTSESTTISLLCSQNSSPVLFSQPSSLSNFADLGRGLILYLWLFVLFAIFFKIFFYPCNCPSEPLSLICKCSMFCWKFFFIFLYLSKYLRYASIFGFHTISHICSYCLKVKHLLVINAT